MGQREAILKVAAAEIGYKEGAGNRTKFGKWYGMDGNPWCMMFVSWCAAQAEIGADIIPKLAYVPYCVDFFKRKSRYRARGHIPQPGDIVFFGTSSHVGIVERVDGVTVYTIEGNTAAGGNNSNGDGVYRRQRTLSNSWIMGYGVPAYEEEDVEIKVVKVKSLDTGDYIEVQAVNVEGNNYIKLRDIEKLVPVAIGWDGTSPTMNLTYR